MQNRSKRHWKILTAVTLYAAVAGCGGGNDAYRGLRMRVAAADPAPSTDATGTVTPSSRSVSPLAGRSELDLESLRREVLARNPSLAAMHSSWQASLSRYPQVTALRDPEFSYALAPNTIDSDSANLGEKFELRQHFPWPGKLALRGEAAIDRAEAAGYDFEAMRIELLEAVDLAFYQYYFIERSIEINHVNQELLRELKRIAEARYGAGLVEKQDALQAEVEHQHLVHRGIVLRRIRDVAAARINTLLNVPPASNVPAPPKRLQSVVALPSYETLTEHALDSRPELEALAARVRAFEAEVRLAEREYLPDLSVSGAYNSLWGVNDRRTLVGVGINLPLQISSRKAAVDEAEAKRSSATAELAARRAAILFDVTSAAEEVEEGAHVVNLYDRSIVPAADESLAAARSGYESGTNDFLTLVAAEKTLMLSRLGWEEAMTQYHQSRARLERAIAGRLVGLEQQR